MARFIERAERTQTVHAASASEPRPAASATFNGTDTAARRSCSARLANPLGGDSTSVATSASSSMEQRYTSSFWKLSIPDHSAAHAPRLLAAGRRRQRPRQRQRSRRRLGTRPGWMWTRSVRRCHAREVAATSARESTDGPRRIGRGARGAAGECCIVAHARLTPDLGARARPAGALAVRLILGPVAACLGHLKFARVGSPAARAGSLRARDGRDAPVG